MFLVSTSQGGCVDIQEHMEEGNSNHQGHGAAILLGHGEMAVIPQFGEKAEGRVGPVLWSHEGRG